MLCPVCSVARHPQKHGPVGGREQVTAWGGVRGSSGSFLHPPSPATASPSPECELASGLAPPSRPVEAGTWHQRWGSTCPQVWAPASLGAESSLEGARQGRSHTPRQGSGGPGRPQTGQAISKAPAEAQGLATPTTKTPAREEKPLHGQDGGRARRDSRRRGDHALSRSPLLRPSGGSQSPPCSPSPSRQPPALR